MAYEETLALIKPDQTDCLNFIEILNIYQHQPGLKIIDAKIMMIPYKMLHLLYVEHRNESFFAELLYQMMSGPVIVLKVGGEDVIGLVRDLNGATNPAHAEPGSIRHAFGTPDGGPKNAVHGSEHQEAAKRELALFFPESPAEPEG